MASSSAPNCRRLEGKSALVTASTAGIGLATARRLAQEGARVVVCSRKSSAVDKTVADLRAEGLEVSGVACHVGSPEQLDALIAFAVRTYGSIDLLVSNAAVNPTAGALADIDGPSVDKILDINGAMGEWRGRAGGEGKRKPGSEMREGDARGRGKERGQGLESWPLSDLS